MSTPSSRSSWADVADAEPLPPPAAAAAATPAPASNRPARTSYLPPHLRNRPAAPSPTAPPPSRAAPGLLSRPGNSGGTSFSAGGGARPRGGRAWDREPNPFAESEAADAAAAAADPAPFEDHQNTGINFDAYEDIPVETSGRDVPPPVATFAEIDLGAALNDNIRRCKYVRPTPVQRNAIPISLAARDLMACAQTGSGKTAAFCFPIISGIMRGPPAARPQRGGMRTAYPHALILSPTRELSMQVSLLFPP
jgi:ATP-dependent RNA helicase DDX3X